MTSLSVVLGILVKGGRIWGICPSLNSKGVKPVDLFKVLIRLKWMTVRDFTQPLWFLSIWKWIHWLIALFICLLAPSISGWYEVDIFNLVPVNLCNACQKWEMNSWSRSEMMSKGKLSLQYQWTKKICSRSSAVRDVMQGTIQMSEPRWLVRVMMQSKPLSSGNGPMKLIATELPQSSGTGSGWSGQLVLWLILGYRHSTHDGT